MLTLAAMRQFSLFLALACVCSCPAPLFAQEALNGFEARSLQGSKGLSLPYRLYKVQNPVAGNKYPLILFLHGAGERGDNNTSQLTANAGATVWATPEHQAKHPAYVIAPQCPAGKQWVDTDWTLGSYSTDTVAVSDALTTALEIADAVAAELAVDPARHYITGLSMGGYGTWDALVRSPNRFAAALPICGAGDPSKADLIKELPLWTFHGDADVTVPVKGSRDMVTALEALGSPIEYDEYPGVGHDSWTQTYANEAVIDWLFQFEKEIPGMGGSGGVGGAGGSATGGTPSGGAAGAAAAGTGSSVAGSGGVSSAGTPSTGGGAAGSSAGVAGSSAGTASSMPSNGDAADDGGCSFRPPRGGTPFAALALACGFVALSLARRRYLAN
jgi:poly(3-hydroxybutyrate) depolymerase